MDPKLALMIKVGGGALLVVACTVLVALGRLSESSFVEVAKYASAAFMLGVAGLGAAGTMAGIGSAPAAAMMARRAERGSER